MPDAKAPAAETFMAAEIRDTPAAVAIAAQVRRELERNGVAIRAFAAAT